MSDSLLTAATLARWLRASGALPDGDVTDLHIDLDYKTDISKLLFLTATYTPNAPTNLPSRLVVKTSLVQPSGVDYNSSELQFYRVLSPVFETPPVVRCLAALENEGGVTGILVLEDLRATHDHPPWPIPPSRPECEMAIDALVHVHAKCWESSTLGNTIGELHTEQSLRSMLNGITTHLPGFMDEIGSSLTVDGRSMYERVFSSSLKPWLRLTDPRGLTIINGDAHTWNFLFPRSGSGAAFLIDWQLWHVDVGVRDLAFFMASHWHPSRRRELETPLIRRYHEALLVHGITNYSYEDLWLDYRRCVVRNLTFPIILWSVGRKPEAWWHLLECALAAYRDLECDELL
jgi:hypothetical protein